MKKKRKRKRVIVFVCILLIKLKAYAKLLSETCVLNSKSDGGDNNNSDNKLLMQFLENSKGLWAFQSQMRGERIREWNESQSRIYPHCQICLLFKKNRVAKNDLNLVASSSSSSSSTSPSSSQLSKHHHALANNNSSSHHNHHHYRQLPVNSEKIVPEICFTKSAACKSNFLAAAAAANNMINDENIDRLVQCNMCKLTVHQSNFGTIFIVKVK